MNSPAGLLTWKFVNAKPWGEIRTPLPPPAPPGTNTLTADGIALSTAAMRSASARSTFRAIVEALLAASDVAAIEPTGVSAKVTPPHAKKANRHSSGHRNPTRRTKRRRRSVGPVRG